MNEDWGKWSLASESDGRWNCSGNFSSAEEVQSLKDFLALKGTLILPAEYEAKLNKLTEELGEPPADLILSCQS